MPTAEQQDILDALAAAAVDLMVLTPYNATLVRPTLTSDGAGGQTAVDGAGTTVLHRKRSLSAADASFAGKVAPGANYRIVVPLGTDVATSDAFLIGGVRYEVLWVSDSTFAVQVSTLCVQMPAGS